MNAKDLARLARTFRIDMGSLHARGAPAVILAVSSVVLAAGVARAIREIIPSLPETLREARALIEAARTPRGSLPSGS